MNYTENKWVRNPPGPNSDSPGYSWNPITGCSNGCWYCYAKRLASSRVKEYYLANTDIAGTDPLIGTVYLPVKLRDQALNDPFYPRIWYNRLSGDKNNPISRKEPIGVFVCNMGDLFGEDIPDRWIKDVLEHIECCPQHRFYLLTKQPQRMAKFSPFPSNTRVGVTATNDIELQYATAHLSTIQAESKYINIEPLLSWDMPSSVMSGYLQERGINQVIVGAYVGKKTDIMTVAHRYPDLTPVKMGINWTLQPPIEWLRQIVDGADEAHTLVYLRNSLKPRFNGMSGIFAYTMADGLVTHVSTRKGETGFFASSMRQEVLV